MKRLLVLLLALMLMLSGCAFIFPQTTIREQIDWGSFTPDTTYSYDNRYYATQRVENEEVEKGEYIHFVYVDIYATENDEIVYTFLAARAMDFWGICWETDSYNIWIQSGDVGVFCYEYKNGVWAENWDLKQPDDIRSKWDDRIK